jgi:hypothetical protein
MIWLFLFIFSFLEMVPSGTTQGYSHPSCKIVDTNHFATTCDHGQTTVDYHCIYFTHIHLYKV